MNSGDHCSDHSESYAAEEEEEAEEEGSGLVECRICQEEEDRLNLEVPCGCSGSVKVPSTVHSTSDLLLFTFSDRILFLHIGDVTVRAQEVCSKMVQRQREHRL